METLYTYDDLTRMTGLLKDALRRRIKRLERSSGIAIGRTEVTGTGILMTFTREEVETFLRALVELQEIPASTLDEFRAPQTLSVAAAPPRSGGHALLAPGSSTVSISPITAGMDELAVSHALSEVAEKRLPLRPNSVGILIALFENRGRPYTADTIRHWCKGRGHSFERIGFKFTWSEGAVIVSVPLL